MNYGGFDLEREKEEMVIKRDTDGRREKGNKVQEGSDGIMINGQW